MQNGFQVVVYFSEEFCLRFKECCKVYAEIQSLHNSAAPSLNESVPIVCESHETCVPGQFQGMNDHNMAKKRNISELESD